jgi:hypothetical protein
MENLPVSQKPNNVQAIIIAVLFVMLFGAIGYAIYTAPEPQEGVNLNSNGLCIPQSGDNGFTCEPMPITPLTKVHDTDGGLLDEAGLDPDTKIYVSKNLGIRFRYDSNSFGSDVVVTEEGNKIYVHLAGEDKASAQSLEVFENPFRLTLDRAVTEQFLSGHSQTDCYVSAWFTKHYPGYSTAYIDYPPPTDPNLPEWENHNCPAGYSKTNGVSYFLMNNSARSRYIYLSLGQASTATDGSPAGEQGYRDWSQSIQIFEIKNP